MHGRPALFTLVAAITVLTGCASNGSGPPAVSNTNAVSTSATPIMPDNGVAALSAGDILATAREAINRAQSFRLTHVLVNEQHQHVYVETVVSGSDEESDRVVDGRVQYVAVIVGGGIYVHGTDEFYSLFLRAADIARVKGRWVLVHPNGRYLFFQEDARDYVPRNEPNLTKGLATTVNNVPTIEIQSDYFIYYIATTGPPYPVFMQRRDPDTGGLLDETVAITDINKPMQITAPEPGNVIELTPLPPVGCAVQSSAVRSRSAGVAFCARPQLEV